LPYLWNIVYKYGHMPKDLIRTTVDIPAPIDRKLKEQAAQQGCSVRDLVTRGIEQVLLKPERPKKRPVAFPLIDSEGPKVRLTGEHLHELIEFP
jgi:hypothetical protein